MNGNEWIRNPGGGRREGGWMGGKDRVRAEGRAMEPGNKEFGSLVSWTYEQLVLPG